MYALKNQPPEGSRARRTGVKPTMHLKQAVIVLVGSMGLTAAQVALSAPAHHAQSTRHAGKSGAPASPSKAKQGRKVATAAGKPAREGDSSAAKPPATADDSELATQSGVGSWYGNYFHGRQTASGELFNMHAFTAAHRTLPIPSYARVQNLDNGKEVIVRVNDRGPYVGRRVIDLSMAAAQRLGIKGLGRVRIEPVSTEAILSGKWREEDIRPSGPSQSGEASVATVASVKTAKSTTTLDHDPATNGNAPAGPDQPGGAQVASALAAPAASETFESPFTPLQSADADRPVTAEHPQGHEGVASAVSVASLEHAERSESAEPTGAAPVVKHPSPRVRNTAASATSAAGISGTKDAKDGAGTAPALAGAHPPLAALAPTAFADLSVPAVSSRASAPNPFQTPGALAAAQGSTASMSAPAAASLSALAPVVAAASAATPAVAVNTLAREATETAAAPVAAQTTSILASVAANVVSPVLSGIARSATGLKDTVVNFALSRPAQKHGAVQIDPARTSNGKGWWLQLGVFDQSANAMTFQHKVISVAPWLAPLMGIFDERGEQKLQAGPYPSREQAQQALERARDALKVNPVMVQRR